jgi:lysophospholipase L1-like esterase
VPTTRIPIEPGSTAEAAEGPAAAASKLAMPAVATPAGASETLVDPPCAPPVELADVDVGGPAGEAAPESSRTAGAPRLARHKTIRTLIWMVLLFVAAEGAVRVRAYSRHGVQGPVATIYEPDELLGRRPKPGATISGSQRQLSINRWGFRGADLPKEKPPGSVRIAVLGDSTSFGMEASRDDAVWVAQMVTRLKDAWQADGRHFDAINGAVPGYTLTTSGLQLRERIAPFGPDVVVLYQVGTDLAAHARRQFAPPLAEPGTNAQLAKRLQKASLLVNLIRVNTAAFRAKRVPQERHDQLEEAGLIDYEDRLRDLIDYCRRENWQLVLCTCPRAFGDPTAPTDQHTLAASALANCPMLSLEGLNNAYERYNDRLRRVAREEDLLLIDLAAIVPRRAEYFVDAVHLNDEGHALVGETIARELARRLAQVAEASSSRSAPTGANTE